MSKPLNEITIALMKVRGVIENRGWIQERYYSDEGVCLVGAIEIAFGARRVDILKALLPLELDPYQIPIRIEDRVTRWNDEDGRTKEQVLALLDKRISESMEVGLR